ncbi:MULTISPECIES: glycosyltransferase family 4 protein [Alteromonas]|uniref:glycosyltransferase family 4 protein n=1 Tax=Alteromonas TaxID=226 RepID=UPI001271DE6F|nr:MULTISPECIES: glycosyltransferase family 4 protein [Alteromonas]CAI2389681.1 Glycosyltransferase involved in cell wall bisynthesis [Alteromonas macleodii]CAI3948891.1 Glycosyltransferase involved in cell wall bisynthesis [Alteromonas macleodii]CAI3949820.1 Glycosyltransferase involved in cell wall bisynthesis [Alteromonas macleodii]CAI3949883.1 Glycosyltransferase involved in cell wall bisynthesis [Alteromonas macleodii]VTO39277.1 Glycosyltransferase involved in cell wall bisynthesis [Alter
MKIAVVGLRGIPNIMGGIESHCQQIYPRIAKEDVQITVIGRSPYLESRRSEYEGISVIGLWAIQNKFLETFLHTFVAIIYAAIFIRPNVLHIHAVGPALFTPLARLLGLKVVVTHHGADYDRQKWNAIAKFILKSGEKMACLFANKVIVVGRSLTSTLKMKYPKQKDRITFIPNGTLAAFGQGCTERDLPKDLAITSGNYILAVARLVPEKGLHDLVDAYNKSETTHKLVIVGDADHNDDYSRKIKSKASEKVIIAGRRGGSELQSLYKFARVFVLPSYHEGHPIVALEAISAGTQVLLSDIQPNLDIALQVDCYFRVGDVNSLTTKLNELDNLNLEIDQSAFLARYDWDAIAVNTLRQYMKATGRLQAAGGTQ